jgi:hypothetical protein
MHSRANWDFPGKMHIISSHNDTHIWPKNGRMHCALPAFRNLPIILIKSATFSVLPILGHFWGTIKLILVLYFLSYAYKGLHVFFQMQVNMAVLGF